MTVFLTGATGFIGRHVLALLLESGDTVITYGREQPMVLPVSASQHHHILGDLSTGVGLTEVPWAEVDQVIHLAAAGVKASRRVWPEALAVNVVGTQRIFDAILCAPSKPRVFLARTFYEELVVKTPSLLENPYIATKHTATQIGRIFANSYAGDVLFGNFFQVYGPGDDPGNVLSYAAREFKAGRAPVFGSGQALRDWIFITDAAAAVIACIQQETGGDYDIGTSRSASIREMVESLGKLSAVTVAPIFDPSRDRGDQSITILAKNPPPAWKAAVTYSEGLKLLYKSA